VIGRVARGWWGLSLGERLLSAAAVVALAVALSVDALVFAASPQTSVDVAFWLASEGSSDPWGRTWTWSGNSAGPNGIDERGQADDVTPRNPTLGTVVLAGARRTALLVVVAGLWLLPWVRLPKASTRKRELALAALAATPPIAECLWVLSRGPDVDALKLPELSLLVVPWKLAVGASAAGGLVVLTLLIRLEARSREDRVAPLSRAQRRAVVGLLLALLAWHWLVPTLAQVSPQLAVDVAAPYARQRWNSDPWEEPWRFRGHRHPFPYSHVREWWGSPVRFTPVVPRPEGELFARVPGPGTVALIALGRVGLLVTLALVWLFPWIGQPRRPGRLRDALALALGVAPPVALYQLVAMVPRTPSDAEVPRALLLGVSALLTLGLALLVRLSRPPAAAPAPQAPART
jgi:hypothetical protein